jgi:hypothetical protein
MLVCEFKTYGKSSQFTAVDEAIRTAQFVRNIIYPAVLGVGPIALSRFHHFPLPGSFYSKDALI